ncbi:farnesyl diphosphate synthase [Hyphobacterium sp. HN65]|uniref:Farnesyl diphosphate synthase n=1 Tax=Hyphobacterium lacteum TaxID=3116575 RepID=A0ABU7LPF3_9PROT|nr:farnesyl diphosphate synthase [Hyphobacterium sp. HN65]MEE2525224.1 farnesyl diphosphate synthase [Hyphobacterium sp. HN65]
MDDFRALLAETADRVTVAMDALLPRANGPEARVISAMRYAALGPGKRLRPFIAIEAGRMIGADETGLLRVATAIECIHAYSLVHDDLPCMDDDDVRRGRPTVHKEYDEATAVLAGDALQTFAFELLADPDTDANPNRRLELITKLAQASGAKGMVGGQMIDMSADRIDADINIITRMQRMKTGALIAFAAEAGAILSGATKDDRRALEGYAHDVGLAFQIRDDLLDAEGSLDETGKAVGKDENQGKATFVTILGLEGARDRARRLAAQAKDHLEPFGESAKLLRRAADYVLERRS